MHIEKSFDTIFNLGYNYGSVKSPMHERVELFLWVYILPNTVCPRISDPFYIVTYYIKWLTTSWTHRNMTAGKIIKNVQV